MKRLYDTIIRNKFICTETKDSQEFEDVLRLHLEKFQNLRKFEIEGKIKFDFTGVENDYLFVYTDNQAIAKELGFSEVYNSGRR